jgi:hypothetical protein
MRIALMRSGTVLYADNHDASPVAGNQDALGVLRYLKQSGHDVCIFGPSEGDFGVPAFSPNFSGLSIKAAEKEGESCFRPPAEEYDFRINLALSELKHWAPEVCVNVAGQQPSHSNPGNPWGCKPLYTAISTNYPMLKACEDLKLRRIVILNDPRNLPREHENAYMFNTVPAAVLSQRSQTTYWEHQRSGRKMRREEVYAGCENWWTYGMPYASLDTERSGVTVIAHGHFHDLRVYGPERKSTWNSVLSRCSSDFEIYGQGWEGFPQWKGLLKHDAVDSTLRHTSQGPMIALEAGFATGKLREYVVAGALPRPVSYGKFHYDRDARYLPANHPARINAYDSWGEIPWATARGYIEELREKSTPNFDPLEAALAGRGHWGGYRWL